MFVGRYLCKGIGDGVGEIEIEIERSIIEWSEMECSKINEAIKFVFAINFSQKELYNVC